MYIRKTIRNVKDKVYENYLLVESVATPKCKISSYLTKCENAFHYMKSPLLVAIGKTLLDQGDMHILWGTIKNRLFLTLH